MGAAMVGRLSRQGFDVTVYNRTIETAERAIRGTGALMVSTPAEAVGTADVVISSLADDAAVLDVFVGSGEAVASLKPGTVVLEMSTIDPLTVAALAEAVGATGAQLVDAPVSGSVPLVEQGSLTVMAGGEAESVARARPVLDALAAKVFHVGPSGSGATMKLAVNAIVHATNLAVSEALVLAERSGVDRSAAYEVFAGSAVASPFITYKRGAFEDPEASPVAFSLDLVVKDLDLILELADRTHVPMAQANATRNVSRDAVSAGHGAADMSVLARYLRSVG